MRFSYDRDADALDIRIREGDVARTEQIDEGTLVDLDRRGELLSIEVIRPERKWPIDEITQRFRLDPGDERMLSDLWQTDTFAFASAEPALVA